MGGFGDEPLPDEPLPLPPDGVMPYTGVLRRRLLPEPFRLARRLPSRDDVRELTKKMAAKRAFHDHMLQSLKKRHIQS